MPAAVGERDAEPPPELAEGDGPELLETAAGGGPPADGEQADTGVVAERPAVASVAPPPVPASSVNAEPEAARAASAVAGGDRVILTRGSNLRAGPGPDALVLARLREGEALVRLEPDPVLGYYRVLYGGRAGWVWWLNVAPEEEGAHTEEGVLTDHPAEDLPGGAVEPSDTPSPAVATE